MKKKIIKKKIIKKKRVKKYQKTLIKGELE